MTPPEIRAAELLRRAPADREARVAEIGFGVGKMARALLAMRGDLRLVTVDNWKTAEKQPAAYRATRDNFARRAPGDAHNARAVAEAIASGSGGRFRVVSADSLDAARQFPAQFFDVVFIDADHSEPAVAADVRAWWPKVRIGGWIGGHDYDNADPRFDFSGVRRAVDRWADGAGLMVETGGNFTWWTQRGHH